eukprot:NODE_1369_length_1362_cov_55.395142_g1357_i0.p1 GENE.NODE_1369_length_1362_cov_55.395142_g1357_i0~~NODE_1369_length_1362_cov_55.395142_g1357_i0.p1  ORF type:complete len:392 (-),score=47.56 NODE_1369_length_1362_cov_55.395142_g1357_i0:98-1273(-)
MPSAYNPVGDSQVPVKHYENVQTEDGIYSGQMREHPLQRYKGTLIKHGKGKLFLPSGDTYEGLFDFDAMHGEGVMHYTDGSTYDGEWRCHSREGMGVQTYADATSYEGRWESDKRHGEGIQTYATGDRYEGLWANDQRCGYGTLYYADGQRFEGIFGDDLPNGEGTLWLLNGDRYEGKFKDNIRHGAGAYCSKDGNRYVQEYVDGKVTKGVFSGAGTVRYTNGDQYTGEWSMDADPSRPEGCRHGLGALSFVNGAKYEGQFECDRMQGYGRYVFSLVDPAGKPSITENDNLQQTPDRTKRGRREIRYEGGFYDHKINGYGTMFYDNGDKHEGFWHDSVGYGLGFDVVCDDKLGGAWRADHYEDGRKVLTGEWNWTAHTQRPEGPKRFSEKY